MVGFHSGGKTGNDARFPKQSDHDHVIAKVAAAIVDIDSSWFRRHAEPLSYLDKMILARRGCD